MAHRVPLHQFTLTITLRLALIRNAKRDRQVMQSTLSKQLSKLITKLAAGTGAIARNRTSKFKFKT
jgi:hypothetical protein